MIASQGPRARASSVPPLGRGALAGCTADQSSRLDGEEHRGQRPRALLPTVAHYCAAHRRRSSGRINAGSSPGGVATLTSPELAQARRGATRATLSARRRVWQGGAAELHRGSPGRRSPPRIPLEVARVAVGRSWPALAGPRRFSPVLAGSRRFSPVLAGPRRSSPVGPGARGQPRARTLARTGPRLRRQPRQPSRTSSSSPAATCTTAVSGRS